MIRKANVKDIKTIHKLLGYYAGQGLLLPRALSDMYDHLRDFYVEEDDSQKGSIIAACALGICWEDLAEIRSLAVHKDHRGKGLGAKLVQACIDEAETLGIRRVFTLTYAPEFFSGMGFEEIEKSALPHKIWGVLSLIHI